MKKNQTAIEINQVFATIRALDAQASNCRVMALEVENEEEKAAYWRWATHLKRQGDQLWKKAGLPTAMKANTKRMQ